METLGQLLKREREFRGISLVKLADETRISQSILKGIEEDHIHGAPQEFYLRGFLRAYARHVGLNADEILSRYQGQLGERKAGEPERTPSMEKRGDSWNRQVEGETGSLVFHADDSSRWPQILMALAAVAAIIALAALLSTR